jgi:hypothetical protein
MKAPIDVGFEGCRCLSLKQEFNPHMEAAAVNPSGAVCKIVAPKLLHPMSRMVDFLYERFEPVGFLVQHINQHKCCDRDRNNRIKNSQHNNINQNLSFRGHLSTPFG